MEKRLHSTPHLPFYVFKQNFICTESLKEIQENIGDIVEAAKEASWYEFWLTQGNEITLDAWKIKYKDYIEENISVDIKEKAEKLNECGVERSNSQNVSQTYSTDNQFIEDNTLSWQDLWDEHVNTLYADQYKTFLDIFENYYWNLKVALQESCKRKSIDSEQINEIEAELQLLRLAGLPTSFGKRKYKPQKRSNDQTKEIAQIDYLESSDSEYTTASEYSDESESELEMPPVKKINPNPTTDETENVENLHKIIKKTIAKPKTNKQLRNVPHFMIEERSLLKYWRKRFTLFSRFDEGIKLDRESWFSVTPEKVAKHMAKRMACDVIIDGFCGSGGNAIQFAMTCKKVIAIDIDVNKVEMARHNAGIYGVADKIDFLVGDFLELCKEGCLQGNVVFLSPPWGGPTYKNLSEYDIEKKLEPVSASELMDNARKISTNIALFLPRNSKIQQLIRLAGVGNKCEVEHNYLGSSLIGLTAFYGEYFSKEV